MLTLVEKILFIVLAAVCFYLAGRGFYRVFKTIARGKPDPRSEASLARFLRALWIVLSQQTVFKKRPLVSFFHALVFYAFVYYLLVNIVDLLEGFFAIHARGGLWNPFNLLADLLTAGGLIGISGLVIRRFIVKPQDFAFASNVPIHERAKGGIPRDSAIVAAFIIFHVGSRLLSKAMELAQGDGDPYQPVASMTAGLFSGLRPESLNFLQHFFWWGALGSILVFIPYFPRSKHIHLFMAPINLALRREKPGALETMDFDNEETFGAARLEEMPWSRLLDAYSCIMCNRCQEVCPAYATGKALNPATILISERYELNRISRSFSQGEQSPRPLLDFALNEEAAWACTTCNACIEVCPVGNEQMLHILDVRRERVLMEAKFPKGLTNAFQSMERSGNPFGLPHEGRLEWAQKLPFPVKTVDQNPQAEVLYWVGCAPSYDPRAQKIAQSMVRVFEAAQVNWAILGNREKCTGDAARRSGNEYLFAQMAADNVETLNAVKPKLIVTTCPHCFHTLSNEYPQFGGRYVVQHHTEFIDGLIREGKLKLTDGSDGTFTFHDPCYLGRHNGVYDQPRSVIGATGAEVRDPERSRNNSFCCGAGGAQFWKEEERGEERVSTARFRELKQTGARAVATGCPFCMKMISDEAAKESREQAMEVLDVAEILARRLEKPQGS